MPNNQNEVNTKDKDMRVITQLLIIGIPFLGILTLTSCKDDDVTPATEEIVFNEADKSFIQRLELFYYGESINIWEESKRIVGIDGGVEYEIFQPEKYEGTDFVNVTFNLNGDAYADFNNLNFKLKVDMSKQSVDEIEEVLIDGGYLSSTNLILMLGDW